MTAPNQLNVVSISGGKDSLATALVCIETQPRETIRLEHAQTDHEHPITNDYINYLEDALGMPIKRHRADFSRQIARKREYVKTKWAEEGVSSEIIERALNVLRPTGIAFLDLCIWKGRFPSRRAQFCTHELKTALLVEAQLAYVDQGYWVWSWQGIRNDESVIRRHLTEWQDIGPNLGIYRPIIKWPAEETFVAASACGVKSNPLYRLGMGRVGCMPCINESKEGLKQIGHRWPWVVDMLEEWERIVSMASKRGLASFFPAPADGRGDLRGSNIRDYMEWAKTSYGGRQYDIFANHVRACESAYGLCE